MIVATILAGGPGTGLWPYSRALHPKPVLQLVGTVPLLSRALDLAAHATEATLVVAHDEHRFVVGELCKGRATVVLEPVRRNTALPVAVAAAGLAPEDVLVILPADLVVDVDAFSQAITDLARRLDHEPGLGVITIEPAEPLKRPFGAVHGARFFTRDAPAGARWHTGVSVVRVDTLRAALLRHAPAVLQAAEDATGGSSRDLDFVRLDALACARSPSLSFEEAVLAHEPIVEQRVDCAWQDVGTWDDLTALTPSDSDGNALKGDVIAVACKGTYVDARHGVVVTAGLEDTVVVVTKDAVLVTRKDAVHHVSDAVAQLGDREEARSHPRVVRPWGAWERLDAGDRFQVKRITVAPGQALSLQKHAIRAEHWVVVRGRAHVVRGDETLVLRENESTYIPAGVVHRLENRDEEPLEVVEVQTGAYLGEDDIVRVDDRYGR